MNLEEINYTKKNHREINAEIGGKLSLVVDHILKFKKKLGLVAIVLTGSFGRGEGSVVIKNGVINLINDVDVIAVVNRHLPFFSAVPVPSTFKIIKKILREIKKSAPSIHLDLSVMPHVKSRAPINSIANYETANGGRIIWGENVLEGKSEYGAELIPLEDGVTLLFNRMNCLINGFPPANINNQEHSVIQTVKALHACCESLLLLSGKYHYSYEERNRRFKVVFPSEFPELFEKIPQLTVLVDKAIQFKLYPDYSIFPDWHKFWEDAAYIYFEVFGYYMSKVYKISTCDLHKVVDEFIKKDKDRFWEKIVYWGGYLLNMREHGYRVFKFSLGHKPRSYLYAAEPHILRMMRYGVNKESMDFAEYYLSKVIKLSSCEDLFSLRSKAIVILGCGEYEQ